MGAYKISAKARGQSIQHTPVTVQIKEGRPEDSRVEALVINSCFWIFYFQTYDYNLYQPGANTYPVKIEVDAFDADGKALPSNADLKVSSILDITNAFKILHW